MGKGYSQDLRKRVIDAVVKGKLSRRAAAARFGVSDSSAIRWVARYLQAGARGIIGTGGHRPSKLKPHREWLLRVLAVEPDLTLLAVSSRFLDECWVTATTGMLLYIYIGEGIRFKKTVHAREQDRPDVAHRRTRWKNHQAKLDPRRLVFIDETWIKTNRARTHSRCRKGERLRAKVPHGHWKTLTFVGALRLDRLTAPCVIDGPLDGDSFLADVEHCLVPTLRPGDMVVLDNLRSHKSKAVRTAIRQAGATRLLLPQYSPDLNHCQRR